MREGGGVVKSDYDWFQFVIYIFASTHSAYRWMNVVGFYLMMISIHVQ